MNFNDGIDGLIGISIAILGALTVSILIALISPLLSLAINAWFIYLIYKKKVDGDYRLLLYIAIGFLTFSMLIVSIFMSDEIGKFSDGSGSSSKQKVEPWEQRDKDFSDALKRMRK